MYRLGEKQKQNKTGMKLKKKATDKCSFHPSSNTPLFTENGNDHKKPQPDTMQEGKRAREPRFSGYRYITDPASMGQWTSQKMVKKL